MYKNKIILRILRNLFFNKLMVDFTFLAYINLSLYLNTSYLLTYLLTPWSRVLLEKVSGLQLVKKFPAFYGSRRFLTTCTSARNLYLSWASSIQSIYPHPVSRRFILILSSHLHLGFRSGLLPSDLNTYYI
jgi:hypothetical protein